MMRPRPTPLWGVAVSLAVACSGGDTGSATTDSAGPSDAGDTSGGTDTSADTDTGTDTSTAPWLPDLPAATCADADHDWVDLHQMGQIIDVDEPMEFSAASIDALLASVGWEAWTPVPHGVSVWPIRYTTQDQGAQVEATGFVALPTMDSASDVPLMLWLHPTMGFSDACAPTALGVTGAAYPVLFASLGYAVAAPDYLGMAGWGEASGRLHPYVVAEPTAVASLDAARAALQLAQEVESLATPDPTRLVPFGASEGGFAAMWVDRYQPRYAPEFDQLAVLAVVPVTDLPALGAYAVSDLSSATAGLAGVLIGQQEWYGADATGLMVDGFAASLAAEMQSECSDFTSFQDVTAVDQVFTAETIAALASGDLGAVDPFGCALSESTVREAPWPRESTAPVLVITGEQDDLAWPVPVHDDISALCDQGYTIEHIQCADAGHVDAALDTLGAQLDWLQARRNGEALGETCVVAAPAACGDTAG